MDWSYIVPIVEAVLIIGYVIAFLFAISMFENRHGTPESECSVEGAIAAVFCFISIPVMLKNDKRRSEITPYYRCNNPKWYKQPGARHLHVVRQPDNER